jgi:hypothetical protein
MLASITPLGERGRHSHWFVTVAAFVIAATAAGALAGAVLGAFGALVLPRWLGADVRLGVICLVLAAALAADLSRRRVPGPRRQVDERWLDRYRGWVYGAGYGAQLGLGVTTVVTSAATYAALVCAFLVSRAATGALILGVYGALRGLTPLLAAGVRTPPQLIALHARLRRAEPVSARGGAAVLAAATVLALIASLA